MGRCSHRSILWFDRFVEWCESRSTHLHLCREIKPLDIQGVYLFSFEVLGLK